jgi:hypothetical protein
VGGCGLQDHRDGGRSLDALPAQKHLVTYYMERRSDSDCDDGQSCNGAEVCALDGACEAGVGPLLVGFHLQ